MGAREAHRHVHVVHPGIKSALKNAVNKTRFNRVDDPGGCVVAKLVGDGCRRRGVNLACRKLLCLVGVFLSNPLHAGVRPNRVIVGNNDVVKKSSSGKDSGQSITHSACSHNVNTHATNIAGCQTQPQGVWSGVGVGKLSLGWRNQCGTGRRRD